MHHGAVLVFVVGAYEELSLAVVYREREVPGPLPRACVLEHDGACVFVAGPVLSQNGLSELGRCQFDRWCCILPCVRTRENGAHCVIDHEKPVSVVKNVAPATVE